MVSPTSSLLLLVFVFGSFGNLFILFVLVGFWVVPTLFLLFMIAIFIMIFSFLFVFIRKIIKAFLALMLTGTLFAFVLLLFRLLWSIGFLSWRARLLLFRQWFLVAWILLVQGILRKSCVHSGDTPSYLDLLHAFDLTVFMADNFH